MKDAKNETAYHHVGEITTAFLSILAAPCYTLFGLHAALHCWRSCRYRTANQQPDIGDFKTLPLLSSGQSSWPQSQRSWRCQIGYGTESTRPREDK
jgi:hypothetical protein